MEVMPRLNSASLVTKEQMAENQDENITSLKSLTETKNEGSEITKIKEWGTFVWPNGSKYEGEYCNNARHGKGRQTWSDGSFYNGEFENDLRHGVGSISWSNGENYEGEFFKDRRHGKGTYKWPNGSVFQGTFYMDKKEGYGHFSFFNGDIFQGLYKEDEREGPGVVTYSTGQQDVGLWLGEKLIKICSPIKDAFSLKSQAEMDYEEEQAVTYLDTSSEHHPFSVIENILHPIPALDYPPKIDLTQRIDELYSEVLDYRSLAVNRRAFDQAFFRNFPQRPEPQDKVVAWNATPRMMALQKHVQKNMCGTTGSGFDVDAVIRMDRGVFKEEGLLELQSRELIVAAGSGDARKVEVLLSSGKVSPDVADRNGHTALIGASVNWHTDVINILLNHGADVNKLNNEGCSALAAGTIFYYPPEGFLYNIAERYMGQIQESLATDLKQEVQLKSNLANERERRASRINQINRVRSKSLTTKSVSIAEPTADRDKSLNHNTSNMDDPVTGVKSLGDDADEDADSAYGGDVEGQLEDFGHDDEDPVHNPDPEDFDSNQSIANYQIEVSEQLVERCATQLSQNERVWSREVSEVGDGKARRLAIQIRQNEKMKDTLDLLLRRGADPNASSVPMPVLFFAIKSADVEMVKQFLIKGAQPNTRLSRARGGLCPLHIACAIPGEEGVEMTELLLDALADPDARAYEDDSFLNRNLEDEWSKDPISDESKKLLGGRTALQIACARDDNYKASFRVVRLLLEHKADTNLICNGFSPLALAIASGNDMAIDELLQFGAEPSLPLTHGVGSALCVASSTEYEQRRSIQAREQLVYKLINAGADVLAPIPIGPKRILGTAVDYAYYMFNQDRRIAHMPYHALTHAERDTYNARRKLLGHIGDIMRIKAVEREKMRIMNEEKVGVRSQSASSNFVYIGAGAKVPPGVRSKGSAQTQVKFDPSGHQGGQPERVVTPTRSGIIVMEGVDAQQIKNLTSLRSKAPVRKPLFKYCYECGRSVGVRLVACTRCKEVYYCSKACKMKAWNARHKDECLRVGGRSRSPSPKHRGESATSTTVADRNKRISGPQKINGKDSDKGSTYSSSASVRHSSYLKTLDGNTEGDEVDRQWGRGDEKSDQKLEEGKTGDHQKQERVKMAKNKVERSPLFAGRNGENLPNLAHQSADHGPVRNQSHRGSKENTDKNHKIGRQFTRFPKIVVTNKTLQRDVPVKGLSKSAEGERKLAKHRFRTGSPPNYNYVYIDNYSHN
ncbi:unnamed protein product [Lymnaea stagnalis]|uniref:MYND-type domain-containing protein n=1 Tax=Lymnaea stagnalis TaxID=6523 RepID=A0AAV2HQI4_LYMST